MSERRPTLALVRSPHILKEESSPTWEERLYDVGFNVLRVAYAASRIDKSSLVEASIGVVLINDSTQFPRRDLPTSGLALSARVAHELDIPVYLTSEPSEEQQGLAPFITLNPDGLDGAISRQWPPELHQPTTHEVAAITRVGGAEALK